MKNLKQVLENLRRRVGQDGPPAIVSATLPHPSLTRHLYRMGILQQKQMDAREDAAAEKKHQLRQTMLPKITHGIAPPIETLKPICLPEIARKVSYIHAGRILFSKTVDDPNRIIGTNILVEDVLGNCVLAGIYNYLSVTEDPHDFFPKGQYIAFLEPYMRHSQDNPEAPLMLRCDNPQCVVRYDSKSEWLTAQGKPSLETKKPTARDLQESGNELFHKGLVSQAKSVYTRALSAEKIDDVIKVACLSNRSGSNLRLQRWEAAEDDARRVLEIDPDHLKARYRLAKALLRLNKIAEAHMLVEDIRKAGVKDKYLEVETKRLMKEIQGHYDIHAMRREKDQTIHHADYISANVRIGVDVERPSIGTYRGCVATESIEEGAIVCASKAFAFIPEGANDNTSQFQINAYTKQAETGSSVSLSNEIVTLVHRRPGLIPLLYKLSDGTSQQKQSTDMIDVGKIRNIQRSNAFSVSNTEHNLKKDWARVKREKMLGRLLTQDEYQQHYQIDDFVSGSGLWITESLFNHSCNPNCTWSQINDHMFIRTVRPISKGEELTIPYVSLTDKSYEEKCETFSNWIGPGVGFACACDYCHMMRNNPGKRAIEAEVDAAFKEASRMVTVDDVDMAEAANKVLPESRRLEILKFLGSLPPKFCHRPIERVETMHGTVLQSRGNKIEAHDCFKRAAEIEYAISGASYLCAKSLWRLVGSAMNCGRVDEAMQHLNTIKALHCFQALSKDPGEGENAFTLLTFHYAIPWWHGEPNTHKQVVLTSMASLAWLSPP